MLSCAVGAVRVGDVALGARHVDPHVHRPAPADLHRVAEAVDRCRLADEDHVRLDLPFVQPVDDPRSAVGGIAFLVAGDEQRDGSRVLPDARQGRDEAGDGALHVGGAAAGEDSVLDDRVERIAAPAIARRNDVEMAREPEMRSAAPADRHHILGRAVGRLAEHPAMDGEAERLQRVFEHVEHLAAGGRHTRAVD